MATTRLPNTVVPPATEESLKWIALAMTPGIGAGRGKKLVEFYGGVDRIFSASLTDLEAAGLPAAAAQSIALGKSLELAGEELDRLRELGATALVPTDPRYPARLLEIYDPPLILYVRGDADILNKFGIAVVGTRHPTPYGVGMAERLSCDLAARGLILFSGMARGVDTAAHRGALNAHGKTVAIWGTGVDVTYPKENQKLADQILAIGRRHRFRVPAGNVSGSAELPDSQPHHQRHFHRRAGAGGGRVQRNPGYRPLRPGAGTRRLCRPGQCDQQALLGP